MGAYSLSDIQPTPQQQGAFTLADTQQPAPKGDTYQGGAGHAIVEDLGNFARALPTMLGGPPAIAYQGIKHDLADLQAYRQTGKTLEQQQSEQEKAAGYGPAYRYVAAPAASAVGVNVPAMEQSASRGDVTGVLGRTIVPAAAALAPLGVEGAGRVANRVIPSTTRAGAGLDLLTDKPTARYAEHPVNPVLAQNATADITQRLDVTNEHPVDLIREFDRRMQLSDLAQRNPEIAAQLQRQGINTSNPLNFWEARTFLKRANEMKYDSNIPQSAKNQLSQFADALDRDISASAQQGGFGDDYQAMRNEYRRGSKMIRTADQIGPVVGGMAGYELGKMAGEPLGGTVIGGLAGKALGKPVIGGLVRSVVERDAGAPNISTPPVRPTPPSPEAYTRILLAAKDGKITPGYADTLIKRRGGSTRTTPLPPPPGSQ